MITSLDQLDLNKRYTYADYLQWRLTERVELLRGKIVTMSPAPSVRHQRIVGDLHAYIWMFLKEQQKGCQVFSAPFDVRLLLPKKQGEEDVSTVVQPDISVVCDASKLDKQACVGAPDLVVEVLSPGNSKKELKQKFDLYQENAVTEYWIVYPTEESIIVYTLNEEGKYIGSSPYVAEDELTSIVLKGFALPIYQIFTS